MKELISRKFSTLRTWMEQKLIPDLTIVFPPNREQSKKMGCQQKVTSKM